MWVKICANTNLEDALLAVESGADAVGFVFASSARLVTAAQVAKITPHLPDEVERVGVFPDWSTEKIADAVHEAGLTAVQLHGGLDFDKIRALDGHFEGRVRIIQTLHWNVRADAESEVRVAQELAAIRAQGRPDRMLVDSKIGSVMGGTGVTFDWAAAHEVFHAPGTLKLILAGGLTPENVSAAIAELNPWGVDVASGVESVPGRKDAAKVRRFIQEASKTPVRKIRS